MKRTTEITILVDDLATFDRVEDLRAVTSAALEFDATPQLLNLTGRGGHPPRPLRAVPAGVLWGSSWRQIRSAARAASGRSRILVSLGPRASALVPWCSPAPRVHLSVHRHDERVPTWVSLLWRLRPPRPDLALVSSSSVRAALTQRHWLHPKRMRLGRLAVEPRAATGDSSPGAPGAPLVLVADSGLSPVVQARLRAAMTILRRYVPGATLAVLAEAPEEGASDAEAGIEHVEPDRLSEIASRVTVVVAPQERAGYPAVWDWAREERRPIVANRFPGVEELPGAAVGDGVVLCTPGPASFLADAIDRALLLASGRAAARPLSAQGAGDPFDLRAFFRSYAGDAANEDPSEASRAGTTAPA